MVDNEEGRPLAELMGDKTIMVMGGHGVTVVGATVHEAFDELLYRRTDLHVPDDRDVDGTEAAANAGEPHGSGWTGPWGDKIDARMHLDAWRRILDREEADYAT